MGRRKRNQIEELKDDTGAWIEDAHELMNHVVMCYEKLFAFDPQARGDFICGQFPSSVEGWKQQLEGEYYLEEAHTALNEIRPFRAHGPDRFQVLFFMKTWSFTGLDLLSYVQMVLKG